jgi:iron complex outermembrane recepter protein
MKTCVSRARLAMLPLALLTAFAPSASYSQSQLKETVVTATRFAESASVLPFGVSVITAEQIRASGATTVNDAVMKLLGVQGRLDLAGGNNYSLDLRGFGTTSDSNQVVIVDGLRLNEVDSAAANLAAIAIDSVYKIEVLRGSAAVLYGEGATGGAIIVTTNAGAGVQRVNSAQIYTAFGSQNLRDSRASAALAGGGFSIDVTAGARNSDGHRQNFATSGNDLAATAQYSNEWLRFGARGGRSASDSGLPGQLTAAAYGANPAQASTPDDHGSVQNNNAGLFIEANLGDWQIAADASQRAKNLVSVFTGSPFGYSVDAANASLRARHLGNSAALGNSFMIGVDNGSWTRTITQSAFTPTGTRAINSSSAVFVKDDLTLKASGTRLSLGLRNETLNRSEASSATSIASTQQAWELGLTHPITPDVNLYGRLGQSFRLANVDEFSFTNPALALLPQTSRDLEVGARWKLSQTLLELRWYRSDLSNEIGFDPNGTGPFGPFGANVNFDATRRQGLELSARTALSMALDLSVNAASRESRFVAGVYAGKDVPLVPDQTLALRANWRPAPGHTVDGGLNWVSVQSPDFANACKIPAYTTIDMRYAYQIRNFELALGVANLTDQKYYTQAFGCVTGVTTSIYPEPGRIVTASIRVKF